MKTRNSSYYYKYGGVPCRILATLAVLSLTCLAPGFSMTIQGGIEHVDNLSSVDDKLKAGATCEQRQLQKLTPNNLWYKVPDWAAGTWVGTKDYRVRFMNFKSGEIDCERKAEKPDTHEVVTGWQTDRQGQIWQWNGFPYTDDCEDDDQITHQEVISREALHVDDNLIVARFMARNFELDKVTRKVVNVVQTETIKEFRPANGRIELKSSIKTFDENGTATAQWDHVEELTKVQDYRQIDWSKGRNMQALFREYLQARNLKEIVP